MMPTIPDIPIPTIDDLQPLYDAAQAYGELSQASSEHWGAILDRNGRNLERAEAEAKRDAESRELRSRTNKAYCEMTDIRRSINGRLPGLDLSCPAPYVGWPGRTVADYVSSVRYSLESYVRRRWVEANRAEIDAARARVRKARQPKAHKVGMTVYDTSRNDALRIVKVTHKGGRVHAYSLTHQETMCFLPRKFGDLRRISRGFAAKLLELRASQAEALARFAITPEPAMEAVA